MRMSLLPIFYWTLFFYGSSAAERRASDFTARCMDRTSGRIARHAGPRHEYAVAIDAGSTGSRVRVYRWPWRWRYRQRVMRDIELLKPTLKITPGLSAVANNETLIRERITMLIHHASDLVPDVQRPSTPIYVMATAGMRLLIEDKMNQVMRYIDSLMRDSALNPFYYLSPTNCRILSGEEEGVFAWIAVNYLAGAFDGYRGNSTAGILEMGGASTQIAFLPRGNVLADKFPVRVNGIRYPLYVHSYLYYGQQMVDLWVKRRLVDGAPDTTQPPDPVNNPCMLKGDIQESTELGRTFNGTGDPDACIDLLNTLVYKVEPWKCHPKPCAIGSFYQPTLPRNMTFYAVGAFIYTLRTIGALRPDGVYYPSYGLTKAIGFCQKTLDELLEILKPEERRHVHLTCLQGLYIAVLLTRGYGFANNTDKIYVVRNIHGQSPDWTLGAVLYENIQQGCWLHRSTGSINRSTLTTGLVTAVVLVWFWTRTLNRL